MSSMRIELDGDADKLIEKLKNLSTMEKRGVLNAMAEAVKTSTQDRFDTGTDPDGKKWKSSMRAEQEGGKTLQDTGALRGDINTKVTDDGFAVGTNDIRAAIHQFGGTIRAKNREALRFVVGESEVFTKQVTIPARPFLGINRDDEEELIGMMEDYFEEQIDG